MILGIDVGTRTFGWAVIAGPPNVRVLELGELYQPDGGSGGAPNSRRAGVQALLANEIVGRHAIGAIVGEARSIGGHPAARVSMAAAQSTCWGMLATIAALRGIALFEIAPKVWQSAVVARPPPIDYEDVAAIVTASLTGRAREQIAGIVASRRSHAIDAAGVGMFAAAWPERCELVARRRSGA